jgi:hypothetical protein
MPLIVFSSAFLITGTNKASSVATAIEMLMSFSVQSYRQPH